MYGMNGLNGVVSRVRKCHRTIQLDSSRDSNVPAFADKRKRPWSWM
jgi:hypothetical protein